MAATAASLTAMSGLGFMPDAPFGEPTNWLTVATIDERQFGMTRDALLEHLDLQVITARPAWKPMHLQPVYAGRSIRGGNVAEEILRTGLCLPGGSGMPDADLARVVEAVRNVNARR